MLPPRVVRLVAAAVSVPWPRTRDARTGTGARPSGIGIEGGWVTARRLQAGCAVTTRLRPRPPFDFDATVHKPSHFPTPTLQHRPGSYWQTLRLGRRVVGLRLRDRGTRSRPEVELRIFSPRPLGPAVVDAIAAEVAWRFDLGSDLAPFVSRFRRDAVLGPVLARSKGQRVSTAHSFYEYLVVATVLQNCTVRRSVQMLRALLERLGTRVAFDDVALYAFWPPARLAAAGEKELRELRVGYRARSLVRVAEAFARGEVDEARIRTLSKEEARRELLRLYGVGPASVWYLLFDVFHHYDALDVLSPWEQKIFSRLLFKREGVSGAAILAEARRRWGEWRMLAAHLVFEDLFRRHHRKSIPWLRELIRL